MNGALRAAMAAAALVGLSGCNMVVSEEPWFTAADAVPGPMLRDGLWVSVAPDCRFDEAKPAERWPDCADASFVRGDERWSMRWSDTDERGRRRRTFAGWERGDPDLPDGLLVANGDHLIVQYRTGGEGDAPSDDGDEQPEDPEQRAYLYGAIRLVGRDGEGKVTALESWPVQCGPLAKPERSKSSRRKSRFRADEAERAAPNVTDRPFPGLTVIEDNCVAESADAVRRAAVLSEALAQHNTTHWVREGWR